jgi:hypothetical protein
MTDFTESIAFLSIVKIFICRYHCRYSPALSLPPANFIVISVNINECRVLQVSLVLRFKFKTDLIINWIYPINILDITISWVFGTTYTSFDISS